MYLHASMNKITITGGARVGLFSATWPFAKLTISQNKLELDVTLLGKFVFSADDIISIEPQIYIPVLWQGIQIHHRVNSYNSQILFWTLSNPKKLVNKIEQEGLLYSPSPISENHRNRIRQAQVKYQGFPIKTQAAVLIVLIWNLLLGIDLYRILTTEFTGTPLGIGSLLANVFVLVISLSLLFSERARKGILKEGVLINNIKGALSFLIIFTSIFILLNIFTTS